MVQHEDKFFQKVADSFSGFAPEAPEGIYAAVKKRYGFLAFFKWNAMSLNIYYVLMLGAATAGIFAWPSHDCAQTARSAQPLLLEEAILLKAQQSIAETTMDAPLQSDVTLESSNAPISKPDGKAKKPIVAASETTVQVEVEPVETETVVIKKEKKKRKSLLVNEVREVQSSKD